MNAATFVHQLARESRGSRGRLLLFALCLAIGVAAVVAVAGFSDSLRATLQREARQLLAADLRIESRRPLPPEADRVLAAEPGIEVTRLTETVSVVLAPPGTPQAGRSQVVELKAVDGDFPFYGRLDLEPAEPLRTLIADDGAVVAPELLARLGLRVGDPLALGGRTFTIRGRVLAEPDRIGNAFALGPRVFVAGEAFRATGLDALGSRVRRATLVRLPGAPEASRPADAVAGQEEVEQLAAKLRAAIADPAFHRIQTFLEGQPELRRGVERTERFLGLVALLSLVIGGVGVAQTMRAWLAGRLDAIAVWKALGARPREILALYLAQMALLALAGSAAGTLLGWGLEQIVPSLLGDLIPDLPLAGFSTGALLRGLALGVVVATIFALPPLLAALRVPAARVLRREIEPLPTRGWATVVLAFVVLGGLVALAAVQAKSLPLGAAFAGGLAATALVLAGAAQGLIQFARRLPRLRLPLVLRLGLAALGRPGAATLGSVVALGLGATVVVGMRTVESGLSDRLRADLPTDAPTAFLIDIQPSQWDAVLAEIEAAGATKVDSVPVVMARVAEIDGQPVAELAKERDRAIAANEAADNREERGRWALTREQRLTYLERLPDDNTIVAGALWSDPDAAEVSVEQEFADNLGIRLGSKLRFDVQGVPVDLTVTSLRQVRWESFGINFFLVVEPGVLEMAPQTRIAAVQLPPGSESALQDRLAAAQPNITLFAIREVLEKVSKVLARIGFGVRFLGGFTAAAGLAILAGAMAAGAARRGREVALSKSLGMTRGQVVAIFAVESALAGAVGGLIGAVAGTVLGAQVLERGMEIPYRFAALPPLAAVVVVALLAAVAGLAASLRPLARRPIEALRAAD
ncbi:MAG: ABC transporter permease [Thermoanaerobaculia bacterium]